MRHYTVFQIKIDPSKVYQYIKYSMYDLSIKKL